MHPNQVNKHPAATIMVFEQPVQPHHTHNHPPDDLLTDCGKKKKKRESKLEQLTKKAYIELGSVAMKAAAVITGSLAGKRSRNTHHRSRDWSTEDNY